MRPHRHPHAKQMLASVLACVCGILIGSPGHAGDRPNVVLVMADDMGWGAMDFPVPLGQTPTGEAAIYPGTDLWRTPNLRAMAAGGLVFSRMYSQAPTCSPTRASVLTGRAPQRIGIPFANRGRMENRELTLAEYASALGYRTGMFGKWHCGVFSRTIQDANRGGKPNSHATYATPLNSGFDTQYATESKTSTYDPGTSGLTTATRYWTGPERFVPLDADELKGDDSAIIAREALAFIEQSVADDRPFLAVVWFHTPHKPVNTPNNKDIDNLTAYRFAMEDLDRAVGSIRAKLRELGVADDTMLCFTSDNGPEDDQDYCADPLRANKRELYEGGVRVPGLIEWPARVEPGVTHTPMVTTDYLPTLLDVWGVEPVDDRPIDGASMKRVLFGDRALQREQPIFFKSNRYRSVIAGNNGRYKLISTDGGNAWELYDLVIDYREQSPLLTSKTLDAGDDTNKAHFTALLSQYDAWQASVHRSLEDRITADYDTRVTTIRGAALHAEPPASLKRGTTPTDEPALYIERQHATLGHKVEHDGVALKAGTVVNSFLLHRDDSGNGQAGATEITFEDQVLAVLNDSKKLAETDALSFGDPAFDPGATRGLEAGESWALSKDRKTIRLVYDPDDPGLDQVRILTRSTLNESAEAPALAP